MNHKQALLGGVAFVVLGAMSGPALADRSHSYCYAVAPVVDAEAVVAEESQPLAFLRLGVQHHTNHTSSRERYRHRHPVLKSVSIHGFAVIPTGDGPDDTPDDGPMTVAPGELDLEFLNDIVHGSATFARKIGARMALHGPTVGEADCVSEGYYPMPDQWLCRVRSAVDGPDNLAVEEVETALVELTRVNPRYEERCGLFALPDMEPEADPPL